MSEAGITVSVLFSLKPEHADAVCGQLAVMVEDTRHRPGFRDVEIVRQADDPAMVFFFEHWDDVESYHHYVTWRTERGDMAAMTAMMAAPPVIQIWSQRVARATHPMADNMAG
jgi:quinol monooxygenase YgiN